MSPRGDNLVRPPRPVPLSLTINVLFGGFLNQFGWFFFTFGMVFVLIFCHDMDFSDYTRFRGALQTVPGTVVEGQETNMEVNEENVVCWVFQYQVEGQTLEGMSYTNGWKYDEGDQVTVEFPSENTGCSRIVGSRRSKTPVYILLFVGIFPAVGSLLWIGGFRQGLKARRLLANGLLARGRRTGKQPTNTQINDRTVYELTFAFQPEGFSREFHCKARSHTPESLEDEPEEPLLYSPQDPNDAVMLDALPSGGHIGLDGHLERGNALTAFLILISPTLGVFFSLLAIALIAT